MKQQHKAWAIESRRPHDYTDMGLCTCLLATVLPAWVVFIGLLLIVDWVVG